MSYPHPMELQDDPIVPPALRVLIVDDSEDDAALMVRELTLAGMQPIVTRVETEEAMAEVLATGACDIVLSDFTMPRFNGRSALALLQRSGHDVPFILVSGTIGEQLAVCAMKDGASDYILKDNLRRLGPAVERELREAAIRREARRKESVERELLAREVQMRQAHKLQSIGELAAGIALEIRAPVESVGANLRFLREAFDGILPLLTASRTDSDELGDVARKIPYALEQALDGVSRISRIAEAVKEFSHPSTSAREAIDLNQSLRAMILLSRNVWKPVAELQADLHPELPRIQGLASELEQSFLNLIINSAHAVEEARESGHGTGVIRISTCRAGDWVEVRVRDSGLGIPVENRERIFDPFFTTRPVGKGTGHGLAIVRSVVVEKHGGTIGIETPAEGGTEVVLRLPSRI